MSSIYDELDFDLEAFQNHYIMSPQLWSRFNVADLKDVDFSNWKTIKLIKDASGQFSDEINDVPNDIGGIYVYSIEPQIIPNCGSYIMYIGMTSKQSLRKRVKQYQIETGNNFKREKLHRLFMKWGEYVYLHFLPIDATDETIETVEDRLIAALIPPCNPKIRVGAIKRAVKAFR